MKKLGILKSLKEWFQRRERERYLSFLERRLYFDLQRTELRHLKKIMRKSQEHHRLQKQIYEKKHQEEYVV